MKKKVLVIAPYIFHKDIPAFQKNTSGLGRIIPDICEEIAKEFDLFLFTNTLTNEMSVDGYTICGHTKKQVLLYAINPLNIFNYVKSFFIKNSFKDRIKHVYYYVNFSIVKRIIKKIKPDIVLLHGIFYLNNLCIDYFIKKNIRFTICLHGQINNEHTINASAYLKSSEELYLKKLNSNNIEFCVIGSGIKNDFISRYSINPQLIHVINNGINFPDNSPVNYNLREKYSLNENTKIVLYVASLNPNKNQNLLIDLIKINKDKDVVAFIIGDGDENYKNSLKRRIADDGLNNKVFMVGKVDKDELINYYKNANYIVLFSFYEGFGLSVAEGYRYGLPALTFSDLGATEDLYDRYCMVKIESRDFSSVKNCFDSLLENKWDKDKIIQFSSNFTKESMGKKYRIYLNYLLKNK